MPTSTHPAPAAYWLTHNYTDKAKFHADPECEGLAWARTRAEDQEIDIADLLASVDAADVDERTTTRLLCRICALEGATVRLLSTPDASGRDVTVSIAAAAPGRVPSETAVARLLHIGEATGLSVATGGRAAAVLYGVVPASALDFLDRNFDVSLPPPGLPLEDDVVTTAWSLSTQLTDREWFASAATCT